MRAQSYEFFAYLCQHMYRYIAIFTLLAAFALHSEVFYFTSDSVAVPGGEITAVEVRAANASSKIGGSKNSGWQLSWTGFTAVLRFDFRNFVDGISDSYATIECNGSSARIKKGINTAGEFNTIAVEWRPDGSAAVLVGEHDLKAVLSLPLPKPQEAIRIAGINGDVIIQDVIVETNANAFDRLQLYSEAETADALRWEYLDRTNDPKMAIIGGKYTLAQIGEDLIYVGGAVTNASHWRPGMLKGHLTPTGFDGYYKLQWYDATGRKMPGENFAEHDVSLGVLKLTFPELGATIRLKLADKQ